MYLWGRRQRHNRYLSMKALDFVPPAKGSSLSADNETRGFRFSSAMSSESFDALMSRELAKPSREQDENFYAARKYSSGSRSNGAPKNTASAARKARPADPAKSASSDASPSPATQDASVGGAAKEKSGGDSPDKNPDSISAQDHDPSIVPVADCASLTTTAAVQTLASIGAAQIALEAASAAVGVSKIGGAGAGNDPGATAATPLDSIPKTAAQAPESAQAVSGKISKPGANEPARDVKEFPGSAGEPAKKSEPAAGAAPIQALLDKAQIGKEHAPIAENSASLEVQSPASEAAGISAAQQVATMNNTDNAPIIAGSPEQNLPGTAVVAAAQSPASERPASKPVSRVESPETTATANSFAVDRSSAALESFSSNLVSASSQADLRVRALERTHDIIALHGMRLKESNADSLHVVLKPGAGLQLSLQLKQNGDGIEAHAVLQRGDFNQLNQHWTELQRRLEERGIRLAPLGHENSAANNGNENLQRPPHQPDEQNSPSAGAFAGLALAGPAAGSSAPRLARAAAERGWESWA
jgi:hypothetical protein